MNIALLNAAVNFADDQVWTLFLQFLILFVAILIGNILRTRLPFVKKLLIPSSLLGGLLIFLIKFIPIFDSFINTEIMQIITYHCLGFGFAALTLKTAKEKRKVSTVKIVESGAIMASSYLVQVIFGLLVSLALFYLMDSFYGAGLVLPMGFGQGTGSALSWGSKFENGQGFVGGASFGLTVATIGFIVASVGGVIYLNVMKRKGKLKVRTKTEEEKKVADFEGKNEIPNSESIDKLTVQFCFVFLAYALSYGLMYALKLTGIGVLNDLSWGLNFLWTMLFAIILKSILNSLNKKGVVKKHYVNNYLMDRISGFMFDVMIIAGVAAIEFEDVKANWILLTAVCVVGTLATFVYVIITTKNTYKGYEPESFLTNFGTVTGTVSNGMILLREIDPNYETPAATNIVLQNVPSIIMLAPLLLTLGFAASSLTNCYIALGVYVVLFVIYNVFLFRRKIFKKKYSGIQEEVWQELDEELVDESES